MWRVKFLYKSAFLFGAILVLVIFMSYLYSHPYNEGENVVKQPVESEIHQKRDERFVINSSAKSKHERYSKHEIEIWGKASIAEYLWTHVMNANSTTYSNGLIKHGEMDVGNLHLRFRSGPGIIQTTVPSNTQHLVLILNGKDELKIKFSKSWLDYLVHFKRLRNVAVVMLGDEKCDNAWILPYLKSRGGLVDSVFLIYDSPLIDNKEFFQWPLGVATYRGFPNLKREQVEITRPRQHLCNFLGTVYKNSSREELARLLHGDSTCLLVTRDLWVPNESFESAERYLNIVASSDLTLSPVGQNTECYRIFEAISLGSVPVVEDVLTPGKCDKSQPPLRLLKEHLAPVIYVKKWNELKQILEKEARMSLSDKVLRREKLLKWYAKFKEAMKSKFIKVIKRNFFREE